ERHQHQGGNNDGGHKQQDAALMALQRHSKCLKNVRLKPSWNDSTLALGSDVMKLSGAGGFCKPGVPHPKPASPHKKIAGSDLDLTEGFCLLRHVSVNCLRQPRYYFPRTYS